MSTNISEAIDETGVHLKSLEEVRKQFPEARLERGRVYLVRDNLPTPTGILVLDDGVYLSTKIETVYVVEHNWYHPKPEAVLLELLSRKPELLEEVVKIVRHK